MTGAILAGFAAGVLTGAGIGGGTLLLVYLTNFGGMEQRQAQGINLVFFLFSAGSSMLVHLWQRQLSLPLCILLILSGIPGALIGSQLAVLLPAAALKRLFGAFLVTAGLITLTKRDKSRASFGNIHNGNNNNR